MAKTPKVDREYPSLSILCSAYEAMNDPEGLASFYGAVGTAQAEAYSQACADLGDRVHKVLECWEQGLNPSDPVVHLMDKREQYMISLVWKWIQESKAKPLLIEGKLDSKLLDFSCRVDRVYTFGNDPLEWIVDYKTSSSVKDSYKLQLCGYALGYFEQTGRWVDQGAIVRVEKSPRKKPQLEVVEVHNLHEYLEPLVLLRQMWDFINRKGIHAPNLHTLSSGQAA